MQFDDETVVARHAASRVSDHKSASSSSSDDDDDDDGDDDDDDDDDTTATAGLGLFLVSCPSRTQFTSSYCADDSFL